MTISTLLAGAAVFSVHDSGVGGMTPHLPPVSSIGRKIPLFRQVPHSRFEANSGADVHAFVRAEVDRVTAKHRCHFERFKDGTGVKHFRNKRAADSLLVKRTEGEVPLIPVRNGILWTGMIRVGTGRGQAWLTANFDTGSMDVIVNPGQFDHASSTTAQATGETFRIAYLDTTSAQGDIILDSVSVAGLQAANVAIGVATASNVWSRDVQSVVGLALMDPHISALRRPGLLPALVAQGSLKRIIFGFGLWKDGGARLDIGHIPPHFEGQISWTPLTELSHGKWMFQFAISGVAAIQTALVDTGTTLMVGPYRLVYDVITAAGMSFHIQDWNLYGVYLTEGPTPYVSISIAGLDLVLSAESLAHQTHGALTISGIVGKEGMNGWILGDTFLQNVYAFFDADAQRMGFAPH
ncbi:hypothetical protein V8E36_008836 [Tilletia maclaganii]